MKLPPRRVEGFLRAPDTGIDAVLVYGPDGGLVRERAKALVGAVAEDPAHPFRVTELTTAALKDDPALLIDEIRAMAFGGGRRVVRLRDAGDGLAATLGVALKASGGAADALLVVEGGDLSPRSALRKLFEGADNAAAIACYGDEGRDLAEFIEQTLRAAGLSIDPDARAYLEGNLGGDRSITRGELEKLVLYAGPGARIALEDAVASTGDQAAFDMSEIALCAADGDFSGLETALARAAGEALAPIAVLRAAMRHFQRLHLAGGHRRGGKSADQALAALKPPVFFKIKGRFRAQLELWTPEAAARALDVLGAAEVACKTADMPVAAVCGRALLSLASQAAVQRRR